MHVDTVFLLLGAWLVGGFLAIVFLAVGVGKIFKFCGRPTPPPKKKQS